jgi:DNA-binding transcriptional LysR family regulator
MELLTFQKGSQPHVTLLDLFKQHKLEPKKVHAISSISAMVQLVQGGFGVALLPRAAVERLAGFAKVKALKVDVDIQSLPIHASYRIDPTDDSVALVVASAFAFTRGSKNAKNAPKKSNRGKP